MFFEQLKESVSRIKSDPSDLKKELRIIDNCLFNLAEERGLKKQVDNAQRARLEYLSQNVSPEVWKKACEISEEIFMKDDEDESEGTFQTYEEFEASLSPEIKEKAQKDLNEITQKLSEIGIDLKEVLLCGPEARAWANGTQAEYYAEGEKYLKKVNVADFK